MDRYRYPHGLVPESPTHGGRFVLWCSQRKFYQVVPPALIGGSIPAAFSVPAASAEHQLLLVAVVLLVTDLPIAIWLLCRMLARR